MPRLGGSDATSSRAESTARALADPVALYDERYRGTYLSSPTGSGYDVGLNAALRWGLRRTPSGERRVRDVLDFGCGRGRHIPVIAELLPTARIAGCDPSGVAVEHARRAQPGLRVARMTENAAPFDASSFDLITCIEVMEHVPDAHATARELARLLRPRGLVVVTAPCANRWSGPWIYNRLTGGFEPTRDGIGRFATDEPAHLRRMSSADLSAVLAAAGIRTLDTRWWGHGFTAVADSLPFVRSLPIGVRRAVASLDWRILRRFSNGGAMVTVGEMSS